jgi:hypothetical protein
MFTTNQKKAQLIFWRAILVLIAILVLAGVIQMIQVASSYNIKILHSNWIYPVSMIAIFIVVDLALLVLSWTRWGAFLSEWPEAITHLGNRWKALAGGIAVVLPFVLILAFSHPYLRQYYFAGFFTRLALLWCLALISMVCVRIIRKNLSWLTTLGISVVLMAVVYKLVFIFSNVTDYPFALGWSEVSRFYGASLFFSQRLYGEKISLSVLHPAWHLLLTVPFLFGNLPIWVHRLWQVVLQIGLTAALALGVARRLEIRNRVQVWLLTGWAFLFLMQGPILIHLLVCAIIVIFTVKADRFWRTTIVVLVASIWAGWCRINWFPVPALMAGVIYLLECPLKDQKRWAAYLWKPIFWFLIGTLTAYGSNMLYMNWSGNGGGGNFSSSLTSDLLWYRLFPNATYPHGVLWDLLIVSIPLLLIIVLRLRQEHGTIHPLRLIGMFGILLVLCAGGVVVSTKIGGGSDLHNLDAYLILLLLVGGYLFFGVFTPEQGETGPFSTNPRPIHVFLISLVVAVPVLLVLQRGLPAFTWDRLKAEQEISALKNRAETISSQGGEVLFISQRQLLALKIVDVPLVPEYEQDALMEMVMSHNRAYLDRFQNDLRQQRFAMIVAEPQIDHFYQRDRSFSEENNLWVVEVTQPLLCYYTKTNPSTAYPDVAVYIPSSQPCK